MNDVLNEIVKSKVTVFSTVDSENKPHSRFMELFEARDNKIVMASSFDKEIYKQISSNNNVSLAVQGEGKFYRLEGTVELTEDAQYILDTYENIAKLYQGKEQNLRTFNVVVSKIIEADFTNGAPQFNTYEA